MKGLSKISFPLVLAVIALAGLGTIQADAHGFTPFCPSLSCLPSPTYTHLGQCDHPCGALCDYYRQPSGAECYSSLCQFQ